MTDMQHTKPAPVELQTTGSKKDISQLGWIARLERELDQMLERVSELVRMESPTSDTGAVAAAEERVAHWAGELGGTVTRHRRSAAAACSRSVLGTRSATRKPVLLLGHLDTVWPVGTLAPHALADRGRLGLRPGVLDMKAGVVMALEAIRLVREIDADRPIVLLLSGDEETGSRHSRQLIEQVAKECRAVFVLEPAQGPAGRIQNGAQGRRPVPPGDHGRSLAQRRGLQRRAQRGPRTGLADRADQRSHRSRTRHDAECGRGRRRHAVECRASFCMGRHRSAGNDISGRRTQ